MDLWWANNSGWSLIMKSEFDPQKVLNTWGLLPNQAKLSRFNAKRKYKYNHHVNIS